VAEVWREARAGWALVGRNFNLVKRYLSWEAVFLFYNVVNALTIGLIGEAQPPDRRAFTILYLSIGALLWNLMSMLFTEVANSVSWERWEGTIEYSFMAPIRRFTYLMGVCTYAVLYALVRTTVVTVAILAFFHLTLRGADIPGALLVVAASALPFVGMGLLAAILPLLSTEKGAQATQVIQGVLLLVSGVYYPISALPGWIRWLAVGSPATYTLSATRQALLFGAPVAHLLPVALGLFGSGLVLVPLGLWGFGIAEGYALRTGRLKRSG
jgi:ABC-2 type transport system permease protein